MSKHLRNTFSVVLFLSLIVVGAAAQNTGKALYLDPSQPINVRVDDLIKRMTLEQKASQLVNQARAIPDLQVPAYDWWSEALHGVANAGTATVFPEPVGLAATFDDPLIHEMAIVIGTEARAKHNQAIRAGRRDIMEGLDFWSPNINIFRDPRWGRGQETYGEDPFLTGRMGVAFVTGLQGDDPKYFRVISTPKHYAVHSGPEPSRHTIDVQVSKHDMEDTYLPAFRATVTEGKAESIMCAYNRVNGQPACANTFLLQDQLRGAWKFNGYVVSDCDAIVDIFQGHKFVKSQAEAAAVAIKTGMDNECADFFTITKDDHDYKPFVDAVKQGLLTEADLDTSLRRLFTARMRLGMFDPPEMVPYAKTPESEIDSAPHRQLALKIARESMMLLKNDGVLPLSPDKKKILVVGPLAESIASAAWQLQRHGLARGHGAWKAFASSSALRFPTSRERTSCASIPPFQRAVLSTNDGKPGLQGRIFCRRLDRRATGNAGRSDCRSPDLRVHPRPTVGPCSRRNEGIFGALDRIPDSDRVGHLPDRLVGSNERMWLDGKIIVDDPVLHDPNVQTASVTLDKGHRYPIKIEFLKGAFSIKMVWLPVGRDPLIEATSAAQKADVVVAVVGITSKLEGEEMKVDVPGFRGGDRTSLNLPAEEEALLGALEGNRQTARRRPDERQRPRRELGERSRQRHRRCLVLRRRRRNRDRRDAGRSQQSCWTTARHLLQRHRAAARLRRLRHEEPHVSLLHRRTALWIRAWTELHDLRIQRHEAVEPAVAGRQSAGC